MRIDFHLDATAELSEAADWYLGQSAKAAQDFAIEIERALTRISQNPERFARVGKNCRTCPVTRFPFQVIFRFNENHIRVIAIAHAKRRPNYWRRRN